MANVEGSSIQRGFWDKPDVTTVRRTDASVIISRPQEPEAQAGECQCMCDRCTDTRHPRHCRNGTSCNL
jgi:hypothetical protein